jgi:hypothetical protein
MLPCALSFCTSTVHRLIVVDKQTNGLLGT